MDPINVVTKKVGALPMIKYYMDQLSVYGLFAKYVQGPRRSPVDPAQILSIMVANIVCASHPLYKIQHWVADYTDGLSEYPVNALDYNDDTMKRQTVENNQKPSFTKPTRGRFLKMDTVSFGSTAVPKNNRTKIVGQTNSLKSISN